MVSTAEKNNEKYLEAQVEEIEVLCSIYGGDWRTENEAERSYSMEITEGDVSVTLYVSLPSNYPYDSPPIFTISAPGMKRECKQHLSNLLEEVYLHNIGQTVLFQWIVKIKEYLASLEADIDSLVVEKIENGIENIQIKAEALETKNSVPEIIHGETITDRKSTFQGHVANVISPKEVRDVLSELKKNRKIANATHNIIAYRICHTGNSLIQDCDDDGETNAGGRLLHLLQISNVINVLVVVSRWYGGIHLGTVRFSHINNAARQALEQAQIIRPNKKKN